jgi:hypothetical protein
LTLAIARQEMLAVTSSSGKLRLTDWKLSAENWVGSKKILTEETFRHMLAIERKRADRTKRPFALLLVNPGQSVWIENEARTLLTILSVFRATTRDTDLVGWHETNVSVGVMLTEITLNEDLLLNTILLRINTALRKELTREQFNRLEFSCQLIPKSGGFDPSSRKMGWFDN